jgi:hypothetical protein
MQLQVQVAGRSYELVTGLGQFVSTLKGCLEDGWQPGQDIPAILVSAITNLLPPITKMDELLDEIHNDREGVYKALSVGVVEMINHLIAEG